MSSELSRRVFMEKLGSLALSGAAFSQLIDRRASAEDATAQGPTGADYAGQGKAAWTAPPTLSNQNLLIILVDQMRMPVWLTSSQQSTLDQVFLPNIVGTIRNNSYSFQQYFAAANNCVPSRATLLTGLYAPQTAMYVTSVAGSSPPDLNPAFPDWGRAVAKLNDSYLNNVWWFGKWHLSGLQVGTPQNPLWPYGFQTRTYPGGAAGNPTPDGVANEGTNGGVNEVSGPAQGVVFASDEEIADDFIAWLGESHQQPWCATVSLINPHDIAFAPNATVDGYVPPSPGKPAYPLASSPLASPPGFLPPGTQPLMSATPPGWNWENLANQPNKPPMQLAFQNVKNSAAGKVTDWVTFLNQYYCLQSYVDQQVGKVLAALEKDGCADNTVIVFVSDHGEYAGSHGLRDKGFAAYDEAIRVPLCVKFPGQTGRIAMNQMCSSVDFFGLICDLATGGDGLWKQQYPDLAPRESIWNFLYLNSPETRTMRLAGSNNAPAPYILFTCDERNPNEQCSSTALPNNHIVCLRTKYDTGNSNTPGAKLAFYSTWAPGTTYPDGTPQDAEFYDYNPKTIGNRSEKGNDYFSSNETTKSTIAQYATALGTWTPATGLIGSELNRPLVGKDVSGNPLSQAQAAAQQAYFTFLGSCPP